MSFREIQTANDVINYQKRLTDGYPSRPAVIKHIIEQVTNLGLEAPRVAELCVGPGQLAAALCKSFPKIDYVGLDFMQPFLDFAQATLPANAAFVCADLTGSEWSNLLAQNSKSGKFDVIVSMQSLHDVGGAEHVGHIYKTCQKLLIDGGLFINADLITQEGDKKNAKPRRLTVPHHLKLLQAARFKQTGCSMRNEQFGVCFGKQ